MAEFDAHAEPALVKLTVENQSAADTGAKPEIHDIMHACRSAEAGFSECRAIGVVRHANSSVGRFGKHGTKRYVAPSRQIRGEEHDAGARIERPGRGDANWSIVGDSSRRCHLVTKRAHPRDDVSRARFSARWGALPMEDAAVGSNCRHAQIRSTQIDCQHASNGAHASLTLPHRLSLS